jgi:hypothetical protein
MSTENQPAKIEQSKKEKPKKGRAPRIQLWKGLRTWKAASVDPEKPLWTFEDLEEFGDFIHAAIDHAVENLSTEQEQARLKTDYMREITIKAMRRDGKSR